MTEHTPIPWRIDPQKSLRIVAGDDDSVASVGLQSDLRGQWEANAAFIVKAVNAHDALVSAAQKVLDGLHYRMDSAGRVNAPIPVFDGIAELHSVLASIKELS